MLNKRSYEPEWMDLSNEYYSEKEYDDALRQLDRIGRWLGGDAATLQAFAMFPEVSRIVDVGCGGGFFTAKLAEKYKKTNVLGIDINQSAIRSANRQAPLPPNLTFEKGVLGPRYASDIVMCSLVCHHFNDEELVQFLKDAYQLARVGVIINDLHRHPLAYFGFRMVAPLFFRNRLVIHDGLLSIRRAFTQAEWKDALAKAEIPSSHYQIQWRWAFRWVVTIKK